MSLSLKEKKQAQSVDQKLDGYFKNDLFLEQFEALEDSPLKHSRGIYDNDYYILGDMFEKYLSYSQYVNENGNVNDLGVLPKVALDVISSSYAASIIPYLCTVQNLEEEQGLIYFKNLKAINSRGNVTADQSLYDPRKAPDVYPVGYAGEDQTEIIFSTVVGTTNYTGVLSILPIRPRTINVYVAGLNLEATDNGNGDLLGKGIWGTINYVTGDYDITFTTAPTAVHVVSATYATNFEESGNIPKLSMVLDSITVKSQIFVVGSDTGMFKAYSLNKRFGKRAEDEVVNDLTNEVTSEIGNTIISRIEASTPGTPLDWDRTPLPGVSWQDHRFELIQFMNEAEATIYDQVGRGIVNVIIAGSKACAVLASMPNFEKSGLDGVGAHLYGTLDKKVNVIRAPQLSNSYKMYLIYKGTGFFDAPVIYAPYMPLFVTGTIPSPDNILKKAGLAAIWSAIKVVVPNFMTSIQIIQT